MDTTEYTYTPYTTLDRRNAPEEFRRLFEAIGAHLAALETAVAAELDRLPVVEITE
jgi:hypothetical protein